MRKLRGAVAAIAVALLLTTVAVVATPGPALAADPGVEADFVAGINRVRSDAGLPALRVHDELVRVARGWADRMASENRIWHNPNLGSSVTAYWQVLGENVGAGYEVPVIMQAFVDSPSHYRNLVDGRFDWVGVGVTWGSDGRLYTAHVFMDLDEPAAPPAASPRAAAEASAAPAPPPPPVPQPPPAAVAPERVHALLAAVATIGARGVG